MEEDGDGLREGEEKLKEDRAAQIGGRAAVI